MLTVYKASAGSGKTFQLVVEYLKIIIKNPYDYKHILAVTFTNKATNEMKSRILEQLHLIASGQKSDYISHLQKDTTYSEQFIRQRAKEVLQNILHDYNRFSINTIDSFTQKVIKSFNRELGISPNFMLELDNDMLLSEAVDNLIAKIDKNPKLLKWLKEFSKEKIENNQSQHLEADIKLLGGELFKESFQVFFPDDGESVYTKENLDTFNKELQALARSFEKELKEKGNYAYKLIVDNGFSVADFSYKKTGVAGYIKSISEGVVKEAGARVLTANEQTDKWCAKSHKQSADIIQLVETSLQPALNEILTFLEQNSQKYYSVEAVLAQIRMLGILTDLKEEIKKNAKEKGVLMLSDSNLLLSKIIGHTDSPFVYEKIGTFYNYFMLDEFQDTSGLQWKNLKPLLENSLAEGNANLIVGDVKQSIYRWRNSDWNILANQLHTDFTSQQLNEVTLEYNWRSDKNIIDFNNEVIKNLLTQFNGQLFNGIDNREFYQQKLNNIYNSFEQKSGKADKKATGYVKTTFLPPDDFYEESASLLVEQVKFLQDKGLKAKEIAILIRRNKEGIPIIQEFLEAAKLEENSNYDLSVLSNDSLLLNASKAVLLIIGIITLIIDESEKVTIATVLHLWQSWLKPELNSRGISTCSDNGQKLLDFEVEEESQITPEYESVFEKELKAKIADAKEKTLLASLDETITYIASLFHLFDIETELPFIQTLIDKAGELKSSLSNDLSNFIFWWNEKGHKTAVNINEEVDSIRLLTIHKSKGLEYKAVLIPFLDWQTTKKGRNNDILWCETENPPFNKFPLLPVKYSNSLASTEFKEQFFEEKTKQYIDLINLIYVAFTRAKSVLMINSPMPDVSKSSDKDKAVDYMLYLALKDLKVDGEWQNEDTEFEFGTIPPATNDDKMVNATPIKKYHFHDFSNKIKLRLNSEDFLTVDEKHHTVKNTGKIIHDILSLIDTTADIDSACTKALREGIISEEEFEEIKETLNRNLHEENVEKWFDGTYQVLNERTILTPGKMLRPDRIMFSDAETIVVDYKTGEEKLPKYHRQVQEYAQLLEEAGFKNVSGYLWYLQSEDIEKVF